MFIELEDYASFWLSPLSATSHDAIFLFVLLIKSKSARREWFTREIPSDYFKAFYRIFFFLLKYLGISLFFSSCVSPPRVFTCVGMCVVIWGKTSSFHDLP
jgi:hypothetical protein